MPSKKIKIGIVGLVFGGAFPTIYRDHPDVEKVVICDKNEKLLNEFSKKFGFSDYCTDYEELLKSDVDAIHILTNIYTCRSGNQGTAGWKTLRSNCSDGNDAG